MDPGVETVLIGGDVVSLFPSLLAADSGRIVREATMKIAKESDLKIHGLDYREMATYVRMNMKDSEIKVRKLDKIVPRRKYKHGPQPGMTGDQATKKKESDVEERFVHPVREATEDEQLNLFATALEIAVKFMFSNHIYSFGGRNYLQSKGGPIGLRATMCISRLIMGEWGDKMRKIMEDSKIKTYLEALYVDDLRYVLSCLPVGWRWEKKEKKFIFQEDWKKEDEDSGLSNRSRMARETCAAMNSVYPFLQFTVETEEDYDNFRLPTLDCALFMEDVENQKRQIVNFSFFEKSMKTPYCVMADSAMSEKSKISILSQDLIRRMLCCSETIPDAERVQIIDNYIDRLVVSGYKPSQVKEIVESGLTGYTRKVERSIKSGIPLHRSAAATLKERISKKLTEKTDWYKKKGKSKSIGKRRKHRSSVPTSSGAKSPVSVLFCPQTRHGELARRLREADQKLSKITDDKLKITERAGTKLRFLLCKSDPFEGGKCGDKCLICDNPLNKTFNCGKRNITYKSQCLVCTEQAAKANDDSENKPDEAVDVSVKYYYGESHRSAKERQAEHANDYIKKKDDSHMYKHLTEAHPGCEPEDVKFGMTVIRQHKSAFSRQVQEACLIFLAGNNVMNSKSQYNRCQIPRLSVMIGENQTDSKKISYSTEELDEEIMKLRQKHDLDKDPEPGAVPHHPNKKHKKWHKSKWKRERTDHSDVNTNSSSKRLKMMQPTKKPDAKNENLPPSTPIVDRIESNAIGPKNIFPIFKIKKANVNFSSSDIKVFKANSTEATSHQNVAATAKKKKKNVNVKKGNSILNYLQVKPVWGRAEAGQQHPPT